MEKAKTLKYEVDKKDKKLAGVLKEGEKVTEDDIKTSPKPPEGAPEAKNGAPAIEKEKVEQERTTVKKKLFLEVWRKTLGSVKATCEKVGITRETYYQWFEKDVIFRDNIRDSWKQKLEDVEQQLNSKILEGDASLIRYFLDRRHPLYKPKVKVEGPKPGELSAEDDIDDFFKINNYDDETKDEPGLHRAETSDQKQEGTVSDIQSEQGTAVLLAKENPKEPDPQSPTKGTK